MRPRPIMPSCIVVSVRALAHASASLMAALSVAKPLETSRAEMDTQDASPALGQYLEIAARLGGLHDAEGVFLAGNLADRWRHRR